MSLHHEALRVHERLVAADIIGAFEVSDDSGARVVPLERAVPAARAALASWEDALEDCLDPE